MSPCKFQFVPFPSQWTFWSHGSSGLDNVIRPRDINQSEARYKLNQPIRGWESDHTRAPIVRPKIMEKETGKARNLSRCPPCNDRIIAGLFPTATRENSQSMINLLIFMSYFHPTRGLKEQPQENDFWSS